MSKNIATILGPCGQPFEVPIALCNRFRELSRACVNHKWGTEDYFKALDKFDDEFQCYSKGWFVVHSAAETTQRTRGVVR